MSPRVKHFARHYAEMVAAMLLGMAVLAVPAEAALRAMGSSMADAPALALLGMAAMMTGPMVGWMAYRGHGARANAEMAASMFLPTFAVIGLLGAGLMTDFDALIGLEHAVMLPSMLAAMLLRVDEYAGHHVTGAEPAVAS